MSAHDIRSLIDLLEAIEQGQEPALPKVIAVPQAQMDQLMGALKQGLETLNKKELDEAGWRNKLAAAALSAAALGGGGMAGTADAQTSAPRTQVQSPMPASINMPLNTLRQCVAATTVLSERMKMGGMDTRGIDIGASQYRKWLMNNVTSSVAPGVAGTAINMELQFLKTLQDQYRMMPNNMVVDQGEKCLKDYLQIRRSQ